MFFMFYRFFVQRPNTTVRPKSTRERKTCNTWYALALLTDYSVQNYKHHVKNEDKIDESHKSQLKFDYEIYLLNYTIKIKNLKYLHWVFAVF